MNLFSQLDFLVSNINYSLYIAAARKRREGARTDPDSAARDTRRSSPLSPSTLPEVTDDVEDQYVSDSAGGSVSYPAHGDPMKDDASSLTAKALRSEGNNLPTTDGGGKKRRPFASGDDPFWTVEEDSIFEEDEEYSEEEDGGEEGDYESGKERASARTRQEADQWESVGEWTASVFIVHAVIVSEAEKWTSSAYCEHRTRRVFSFVCPVYC